MTATMRNRYHLFTAYISFLFFDILLYLAGDNWAKLRRQSNGMYKIIKIMRRKKPVKL